MVLLGFRIENELKSELENSFENELRFADTIASFMEFLRERKYDVVLIDDKNFQQDALINLVKKIEEIQKKSIILIIGENPNLKIVAGVIKAGAYDYILKTLGYKDIYKLIGKALKDYKLLAERVEKNKNSGDKLIGQTKEIVEVYKLIGRVADSKLPVLVVGEKGTGKTSVATAIHQFSEDSDKPFFSLNCTSFQNNLLERKLFGYEKGAFEGAAYSQIGDLEKANKGILHLGNIESLSLDMQSKILYLLQEGEFFRMGGSEPIKVDIRIIATTSENLEELIGKKLFIDELYNKLKILEINIPPLRERKDDIESLSYMFLDKFANKLNKKITGITPDVLDILKNAEWKGNVRELRNVIERCSIVCEEQITFEDLPIELQKRKSDISPMKDSFELAEIERMHIIKVLQYTNGNKTETARLLKIGLATLYRKIEAYKITV